MRFCVLVLLCLAVSIANNYSVQAEDVVDSWYIEGQVHPAYELTVDINGKVAKSFVSEDEKIRIFMYAIEEAALKDDANTITITEKVIREIDQDVGTDRSWRFNVRYQSDMTKPETATKLLTVVGQEAPFPAVGHTETKTFAFPKHKPADEADAS